MNDKTVRYVVPWSHAVRLRGAILAMHKQFHPQMFPAERPAENDDTLAASLWWERDLALNIGIALGLARAGAAVEIQARGHANDVIEWQMEHGDIRILKKTELTQWCCEQCHSWFDVDPRLDPTTATTHECGFRKVR